MPAKYHNTAGGVVFDARGRFLSLERDVERDGRLVHEVRLPKGHIDPGETPEQAAMREVGEESGYWDVEIVADLGSARVEFDYEGRHHIRDEHYFLMRLGGDTERKPQPVKGEEALFVPLWLDPANAEALQTYPAEAEFVRRARRALAEMETRRGALP